MCIHMCRLNSPRHSVSISIEIDSGCRFALVVRQLADRRGREALKDTTNDPNLGIICGYLSKFSHPGVGGAEDGLKESPGRYGFLLGLLNCLYLTYANVLTGEVVPLRDFNYVPRARG